MYLNDLNEVNLNEIPDLKFILFKPIQTKNFIS